MRLRKECFQIKRNSHTTQSNILGVISPWLLSRPHFLILVFQRDPLSLKGEFYESTSLVVPRHLVRCYFWCALKVVFRCLNIWLSRLSKAAGFPYVGEPQAIHWRPEVRRKELILSAWLRTGTSLFHLWVWIKLGLYHWLPWVSSLLTRDLWLYFDHCVSQFVIVSLSQTLFPIDSVYLENPDSYRLGQVDSPVHLMI